MTRSHPIPAARAAVLSELEARLLEESVRARLFGSGSSDLRLGRYRLLERIGRGGMGIVFAAHDDELDRRVAIKILLPSREREDRTSSTRLRREAQALARLSHPHVVQVFEVGEAQGHAFVVMELVAGMTVREWLEHGARSVDETLDVFVQAGRGLAAAHAAGLVHRDFKPENVIVGDDGRVRVLDFGLVRERSMPAPHRADSLAQVLTHTGAVMGTPAYMAPEQKQGDTADARSDQFAFCVALHEALCGHRPHADPAGPAAARARGEPAGRIPKRVRRAIARGLAADPALRWPSMAGLLAALDPRRARWRVVRWVALTGVSTALLGAGLLHVVEAGRIQRREQAAAQRFEQIQPRLLALLDAGDVGGAEALLGALEAEPPVHDTAVPARAWSWLAAALDERALRSDEAWAGAFVRAREGESREHALVGLLHAYAAQRKWHGVSAALALLAAQAPDRLREPPMLALRFDAAGARRDLGEALAISRDLRAPARVAAFEPVLAAWTSMRATSHERVVSVQALGADLLLAVDQPEPHTRVVRADESLSELRREARSRVFVAADSAYVIQDDGSEHALLVSASGELRELARFPGEGSRVTDVVAVDLDADGRDEVYVAEHIGLRVWKQSPQGQWTRADAHASTSATHSNADGVVAADLDADGRPELVLGMGPWSAYDVRVFEGQPQGEPRLVGRRKIGHTGGVRVLATPAGPRIVTLATESYPNTSVFPAEARAGAPEGLYLLRRTPEGLESEQWFPVPDDPGADLVARCLFVGDVDGDGLDDVVVRLNRGVAGLVPASVLTWVLRQLPDGTFTQGLFAGMQPLGLVQLDDDPADELLFRPAGDHRLWIAGMGASTIEPLPGPDRELAQSHARSLERAGAAPQAVALADVGALDAALAVTRQLARVAGEQARPRLRLAAARIADDMARSADVVEVLSELPLEAALRAEALERLTRAHLALGRLEDAATTLDAWLAEPELDRAARERAEDLREPVAALISERSVVSLHTTGSDAPTSIDPTALRRGEDGALIVDAFARAEPILAWPLEPRGGPFGAEATLSPGVLDWSAGLELRVREVDGTLIGAGLRVHGGDVDHQLLLICGGTETEIGVRVREDGSAPTLRLRLLIDPRRRELECAVTTPDGFHALRRPVDHALEDGPQLELGPVPEFGERAARFSARLERLELMGVRVRTSDPDLGAAALVEADGAAAIALSPPSPEPGPATRRVLALVQLGRVEEATRELAALAETASGRERVGRLLSARPERLAPLVRQAVGDAAYFALYADARALVLDKRRFTPDESRSLVTDLAALEHACSAPACAALLLARARAHAQRGDSTRARADLSRALELAAPSRHAAIHIELAVLAAGDDDLSAVVHHASRAMQADAPVEIVRDILRARPELRRKSVAAALAELLGPEDRIGVRGR
jgi:hypothetical protein